MAMSGQPRSFLNVQVVARLAGIPFLARRPMQGSVSGRHASPHRGASVEFAEYRKYVPGDDLRRLDWRAFGRTDRHYVKEFEADTNLRCYLILDVSGSMGFGSKGVTKFQYALRIAATLAYLGIQQGDAVGLGCLADGLATSIAPRRNPAHLKLLFDTMEGLRTAGTTQFISVLHDLAEMIRQRALVVIISDFFADPGALQKCFEHFRFRKHDLAAFHLLDPLEIDFKFQRPMRFLDMEGGPALFAEPNEIADRYHHAMGDYLHSLRRAAIETGVDYRRVMIDQDYEQTLVEFLVGRTRAGGVR